MKNTLSNDNHWMQYALTLAAKAQTQQEVPVGAVLTLDNEIIGIGWNQPITQNDPTAHAEILALRDAAQKCQNYRLTDSTLYVTLEPCAMCAGALIHARIKRLVFGTQDPKSGAVVSKFSLLDAQKFNHRMEWEGGCLAEACSHLLKNFFAQKR